MISKRAWKGKTQAHEGVWGPMGNVKTSAKLRVQKSIGQLDKIQKTLKASLEVSEKQVFQIRSAVEQVNAEIQKLKTALVAQELQPLFQALTSGSLNHQEFGFHEIARRMVQHAESQTAGFEAFLANVRMLRPLIAKRSVTSEVLQKNSRIKKNTDRLKILYVTGMFPSDKHGGGLRVRDILSKLTQRHDVDLYSVFNPAIDKESFQDVCKTLLACRLCEHGISFGVPDILKWFKRRGIKPGHYDVIQFEYPDSVPLMKSLRPFGRKLGFTFMESITRHHLQNVERFIEGDFTAAAEAGLRLFDALKIEYSALRHTDFSIAVTEADALFTQKTFGYLPRVVPTGLNETFFKYKKLLGSGHYPNPKKRKSVIFIGYFDHSPNVDGVQWYLRHVHPRLCRRHRDYHFYVVGAGAKNWVDELRHQHIEDRQLSVIGYVEEFRPLLAACKISVAPLISGAGIRGKINQYSALGVPTVATELAACGTDYVSGESILISKDGQQFAKHVSLLLTQNDLRKKIAVNAEAMVKQKYLWGNLVRDLEGVYVGN